MTPPAVLTPTAQAELRQAIRALDTTAARRGLRGAVQEATRRLGTNPNLGSARLYLPRRFRVWALTRHRYLLIYDASRDPVQILRVVHMARDLPRALAELRDLLEP